MATKGTMKFYDVNGGELATGQRTERKLLVTLAKWGTPATGGERPNMEVLGVRTEDSSIEFNADISTTTDIRGITYTDVNKTEPQQSFDPFYIMGGSELGTYLVENALVNDYAKYNNTFDLYIVTMFMSDAETVTAKTGPFYAVKHSECSIIPTSLGGDSYNNLPIEVHYSNNITEGQVTFTVSSGKITGATFTAYE